MKSSGPMTSNPAICAHRYVALALESSHPRRVDQPSRAHERSEVTNPRPLHAATTRPMATSIARDLLSSCRLPNASTTGQVRTAAPVSTPSTPARVATTAGDDQRENARSSVGVFVHARYPNRFVFDLTAILSTFGPRINGADRSQRSQLMAGRS